MNASDFSPEMKENILGVIKSKFGDYEYKTMVDRFGKDEVINMYITALEKQTSERIEEEKEKAKPKTFWGEWGGLIIIGSVCLTVICVLGLETGLVVLFWIYWGFPVLTILHDLFKLIFNNISKSLAVLLGIAVICGIFYGLWILVPWMWQGVLDWWGWLGKHF